MTRDPTPFPRHPPPLSNIDQPDPQGGTGPGGHGGQCLVCCFCRHERRLLAQLVCVHVQLDSTKEENSSSMTKNSVEHMGLKEKGEGQVGSLGFIALLEIVNDLLLFLDNENISIVAFLDLSAAFDTIDDSILLSRLEHVFGIHGTALQLFSSYPSSRTQTISINNLEFDPAPVSFDGPQDCTAMVLLIPVQQNSNYLHQQLKV